jgi:hypothetical protein
MMPTKRNTHLARPFEWARPTAAQNDGLRKIADLLPITIPSGL